MKTPPVSYPPPVLEDIGLGSAYERLMIARLIGRWLDRHPVQTAMEGVLDGMAGLPGLHLLPAAQRGARVTVVCASAEVAGAVSAVYRHLGLADRLTTHLGNTWPADETADLVLIFNALAFAEDWQKFLNEAARHARRYLIVSTTNPFCYGSWIVRLLRLASPEKSGELFDHPSTRWRLLKNVLASHGRVVERAYVDAPWWPDLFVRPGESLLSGTLARLFGRNQAPAPLQQLLTPSPRSLQYRFGPENFPFLERTAEEAKALRAIRRQPGADGGPGKFLAPLLAHHRMVLLEKY